MVIEINRAGVPGAKRRLQSVAVGFDCDVSLADIYFAALTHSINEEAFECGPAFVPASRD